MRSSLPTDPHPIPEYLPRHKAAERLGLGLTFLDGLIRTVKVRSFRVGARMLMIDYQQLLQYIERQPRTPEQAHRLRPRRRRGGAR
jgi:hypothetical protein